MRGSSPRLRGTLVAQRCRITVRFIPAPAGNTRMAAVAWRIASGSSPRLRGTRRYRRCWPSLVRFIPAPAGNAGARRASATAPVHPRACGEHVRRSCRSASTPVHPRACGEHATHALDRRTPVRFIPAPAGNTRAASCRRRSVAGSSPRLRGTPRRALRRRRRPVHPRACGERTRSAVTPMARAVHPRALRGTLHASRRSQERKRFIPAPAGNTASDAWQPISRPVHPRARGERACGGQRRRNVRFIPAPAGNAVGIAASHRSRGSSPRLRGTLPAASRDQSAYSGSSPRPRGTRARPAPVTHRRRFIPAPAGNTSAAPVRSAQ